MITHRNCEDFCLFWISGSPWWQKKMRVRETEIKSETERTTDEKGSL